MALFEGLDIIRIAKVLLKNWLLILAASLVAAAAGFVWSYYFVAPLYRTHISVYIDNRIDPSDLTQRTQGDLGAAQRLVNTYIAMISSNTVLERVSNELEGKYSPSQIYSMISASGVGNTEILRVTVTSKIPREAMLVANAIAASAPPVIAGFVEGSSVKIIDYAQIPGAPFSPNIPVNILVFFAAGFLFVSGVLTLAEVLDTRIKSAEEIKNMFEFPVLGIIPNFKRGRRGKVYRRRDKK
ncbi:MAG: Wzz/FepE/Etk N-terminal domain-containing protein [Oscillospiraceae bacterium]|nr:Wzz/FepE/Etk N-terminal domain-containing protein [Oscillospiraceae bacterium]